MKAYENTLQEAMMESTWRWRIAGVVLLYGSSLMGCGTGVWHPANPLQESKLTIESAGVTVANGGAHITQLNTDVPGGESGYYGNDGRVATTVMARQATVEFQGRYVDSRRGTVMVKIPLAGPPLQLSWQRSTDSGRGTVVVGPPNIYFDFDRVDNAQQFADALRALRDFAAQGRFIGQDEADAFAQVVAQYQRANPKPTLSEEARKLKVQAEFALGKKQYTQAIDRYQEALAMAPWWADGHFNRALLLGESEDYAEAVSEMKKYLALEPNAKDARAAQDKLYQWEGEVKTAKIHVTIKDRAPVVR